MDFDSEFGDISDLLCIDLPSSAASVDNLDSVVEVSRTGVKRGQPSQNNNSAVESGKSTTLTSPRSVSKRLRGQNGPRLHERRHYPARGGATALDPLLSAGEGGAACPSSDDSHLPLRDVVNLTGDAADGTSSKGFKSGEQEGWATGREGNANSRPKDKILADLLQ